MIPWLALAGRAALADPVRTVAVVACAGFALAAWVHREQRDDARAEVAVLTAERDAAQAIADARDREYRAAEQSAQAATQAARRVREVADGEVDRWQRTAAARYRDLRLCRLGAGAAGGALPGTGDDPPGAAGAGPGAVPAEAGADLGGRLAALAGDAERVRVGLAECYAVLDAQPGG